jgi:hypothetical protein
MQDINHELADSVPFFRPEEMVTASDLKDWVYCNRSWLLNQQGFRVTCDLNHKMAVAATLCFRSSWMAVT